MKYLQTKIELKRQDVEDDQEDEEEEDEVIQENIDGFVLFNSTIIRVEQ